MSNQEPLSEAIASILRLPMIIGMCLQERRDILVNRLPFSEPRILQLCNAVNTMLQSYREVGRSINEVCLGYSRGTTLILSDANYTMIILMRKTTDVDQALSEGRLFLHNFRRQSSNRPAISPQQETEPQLFEQSSIPEPENLHKRSGTQQPAFDFTTASPFTTQEDDEEEGASLWVDVERWKYFRRQLHNMMVRVQSEPQCERLIDKEIRLLDCDPAEGVPPAGFRALGAGVINRITNSERRKILFDELQSIFEDCGV